MNIGIDARLLERKVTGIGRFLGMVLKYIPDLDNKNEYHLFSYNPLKNIPEFYKNASANPPLIHQKLYSPFWTNFILPGLLRKHNIDVYFSVNKTIPLKKPDSVIYVSVIHDVFYKIDNKFHPFIYRKYLDIIFNVSLKKTDKVITVSENSKNDLVKFFKVPEKKIKVIYTSALEEFFPRELSSEEKQALLNTYKLSDKFIIYVGVIEHRKNILGILKIADLVYNKNKELRFLLIGKPGHGSKIIIKEIKKRKNVIYLKYVEDILLKKFYSMASVFLFPSLYEGFGLPPLEAMQSGVPVVSSNTSSLPEVIGTGGIMHPPNDYNAFCAEIIRLVEDDNYFKSWKNRGIERAKHFSPIDTSRKVVEVFNSLR